jgi:hypothetical protein
MLEPAQSGDLYLSKHRQSPNNGRCEPAGHRLIYLTPIYLLFFVMYEHINIFCNQELGSPVFSSPAHLSAAAHDGAARRPNPAQWVKI